MFKKYFTVLVILLILGIIVVNNSFANSTTNYITVNITGCGENENEAVKNGLLEALEQSVGAYVYSITEVENFKVKRDDIIAASSGSIRSYKIISRHKQDELIFVRMKIIINPSELETVIRRNVNMLTADDVLQDYNIVTLRQEQLKNFQKILRAMEKQPMSQKYFCTLEKYEIIDVAPDMIKVKLYVRLQQNPIWWNAYTKIVKALSSKNGKHEWQLNYRRDKNGKLICDKYFIDWDIYPQSHAANLMLLQLRTNKNKIRSYGSNDVRANMIAIQNLKEGAKSFQRYLKTGKGDSMAALQESEEFGQNGIILTYMDKVYDPEDLKVYHTYKYKWADEYKWYGWQKGCWDCF